MCDKNENRQPNPQLDSEIASLYERVLREEDLAALEKIVELCALEVFRMARSVLHQDESAQDVVQKVFDEFAKRCGRIDKWKIRPWLREVAHQKAVDESKRQRRFQLLPDFIEEIIDPGKTPIETLMSKEVGEQLSSAILKLPERQRACVRLRLEDIDRHTAAKALGISVSTYHSNLWRAEMRLRKLMKDIL